MSLAEQLVRGDEVLMGPARALRTTTALVVSEAVRLNRMYSRGAANRSLGEVERLKVERTRVVAYHDPGDGGPLVEVSVERFGAPVMLAVAPRSTPPPNVIEKGGSVRLGFGTRE